MHGDPGLTEVERRVGRLQELLGEARVTDLDFENREHLQIIQLSLDMAIEHMKKLK